MNAMQEAEFHLSIYHYFLWKNAQEKQKEDSIAAANRLKSPPPSAGAPSDGVSKTAGKGTPEVTITDEIRDNQQTSTAEHDDGGDASSSENKLPGVDKYATATDSKPPSSKYKVLVDAMLEQFPQHLAHFPPGNTLMQNQMPPIITTLYFDYPALQAEVFAARSRMVQLETAVANYKRELLIMENDKRKDPPPTTTVQPAGSKKKRARTSNDIASMSIISRPDVPADVKQLVAVFQEDADKQKRNDEKRIAHLKVRIEEEKSKQEEIAKIAAAAAKPPPSVAASPAPNKPPPNKSNDPEWKPHASFEDRIQELEHFRKGNGHCRVPLRQPGLGRWVGEMRSAYKSIKSSADNPDLAKAAASYLTEERIALLDSMGFEWSVSKPTVPWQTRFEELLNYKEANGHCNVPRGYKENPSLGEWVHMQRKLYRQKAKAMMGERAEKLEAAGFQWVTGAAKPSFEDRLNECRDFRREHGHLKVPAPVKHINKEDREAQYSSKEERSFRQWAQRQRDEYRKFNEGFKSSLDKQRIRKLDELGFDWGEKEHSDYRTVGNRMKPKNEAVFDERIARLREIKDKYGDCNDIKNLKAAGHPEQSSLYQWMKAQRKAYKSLQKGRWSSLSAERIAKLQSVDFNFEPRKHYAAYGSLKAKEGEVAAVEAAEGQQHEEESDDDEEEVEEDEDEEEIAVPPPHGYEYYQA